MQHFHLVLDNGLRPVNTQNLRFPDTTTNKMQGRQVSKGGMNSINGIFIGQVRYRWDSGRQLLMRLC